MTSSVAMRPMTAWRNALGVTGLGVLFVGVGGFIVLARAIHGALGVTKIGAAWLELGFACLLLLIVSLIWLWQRAHGGTLADLGLGRATTARATVAGLVIAVVWLALSYTGFVGLLPNEDYAGFDPMRLLVAPLGVVIGVCEETMMRGFFMTQLQRAGVSTWLQVVASGACSAIYHALQSTSLIGFASNFVFSFILFSALAVVYVIGRRSLTPGAVSHSLIHVLGDPYLDEVILATVGP